MNDFSKYLPKPTLVGYIVNTENNKVETIADGKAVKFTLAVQETYKDKTTGEKRSNDTYFANCIMWGTNNIERINNLVDLKHNNMRAVMVCEAWPRIETWEDANGNKKTKTTYKVNRITPYAYENATWFILDVHDIEVPF
jgi:single-stranded DNA-binding protein